MRRLFHVERYITHRLHFLPHVLYFVTWHLATEEHTMTEFAEPWYVYCEMRGTYILLFMHPRHQIAKDWYDRVRLHHPHRHILLTQQKPDDVYLHNPLGVTT